MPTIIMILFATLRHAFLGRTALLVKLLAMRRRVAVLKREKPRPANGGMKLGQSAGCIIAGEPMGLGDVRGLVIPKFGIIAPPRRGLWVLSGVSRPLGFVPADPWFGLDAVDRDKLPRGSMRLPLIETSVSSRCLCRIALALNFAPTK